MVAKKTRKKKLDAQTLNEFRAWLSGVEEMQDDGWIPNETQWELIRQRIGLIKAEEVEVKPVHVGAGVQPRPQHMAQPQVPVDASGIPTLPAASSSFDNVEVVGSTAGASNLATPKPMQAAPKRLQQAVEGPVRTPDIDSSTGYQSGFA